jgi:hypothetical protein
MASATFSTSTCGVGSDPAPATEESGDRARRLNLRVIERSNPWTDVGLYTTTCTDPLTERTARSPNAFDAAYGESGVACWA